MLRGRTIQKRNTKRIFSAPWNLRTNRTMVRKIMIKLMHLRLLCGWAQSFFILWQVNSSVTRRKQYYLQRFSTEKIFPCENTKLFPDQQDWNVKASNAFTEHLFLFWISLNCLPQHILPTFLREVKGLTGPGL